MARYYYNRADLMETVAQTIKSAKADGINIFVVEEIPGRFSVEVNGCGIGSIPTTALFYAVTLAYVTAKREHYAHCNDKAGLITKKEFINTLEEEEEEQL
ncbi:MAG: hypothetical protein LUC22_01380 [Prevotella sp.]|nr:hypothetical protein [Prevotella sp.]